MSATLKKHRPKNTALTVRSRVESALKLRLSKYRTQPHVRRSEGFIVRDALESYLNQHEQKAG